MVRSRLYAEVCGDVGPRGLSHRLKRTGFEELYVDLFYRDGKVLKAAGGLSMFWFKDKEKPEVYFRNRLTYDEKDIAEKVREEFAEAFPESVSVIEREEHPLHIRALCMQSAFKMGFHVGCDYTGQFKEAKI